MVGDSPAIETEDYSGYISGIRQVVGKCKASLVKLNESTIVKKVGDSSIKLAALIEDVDLIISLPKLKNHELMYYTGAMKNIFGLVPDSIR